MKIQRLAYGVSALVWCAACARAPEAAAPGATSGAENSTAAASARAPEPEAAAPSPPPAPAAPVNPLELQKSRGAQKSQPPLEEEFSNLEAAERALNQAKADLDRLALAAPGTALPRSSTADRSAEKKEAAGAPRPAAGATAATAPSGLCENACRAFGSLSRAANAVCRLDGSSGSHCTRAKRVVADSQQRVASCSCPAPGD